MGGTIDAVIVGKCGLCGGVVSAPRMWFGVGRVPRTCESCGAVADETHNMPTLPMKPRKSNADNLSEFMAYREKG